jgi:hypothetical protein
MQSVQTSPNKAPFGGAYANGIDFSALSYNELRLPFSPSSPTLRLAIGKKGRHMITISRKANVSWLYYQKDRNVFEMYGEYDAGDDADGVRLFGADFDKAKEMLLNHLAFVILHSKARANSPSTADEICWASEYVKTLPVHGSYRFPAWKPSPLVASPMLPPLPVPGAVHALVMAQLRTSDWLPPSCTLRYDPVSFALSLITCLSDGSYRIQASDDFAWNTTTLLLEHQLAKTIAAKLSHPTTPLHLRQWAMCFAQRYGGI